MYFGRRAPPRPLRPLNPLNAFHHFVWRALTYGIFFCVLSSLSCTCLVWFYWYVCGSQARKQCCVEVVLSTPTHQTHRKGKEIPTLIRCPQKFTSENNNMQQFLPREGFSRALPLLNFYKSDVLYTCTLFQNSTCLSPPAMGAAWFRLIPCRVVAFRFFLFYHVDFVFFSTGVFFFTLMIFVKIKEKRGFKSLEKCKKNV